MGHGLLTDIERDETPPLTDWLLQAAKGIAIIEDLGEVNMWLVEINNGIEHVDAREGTIVARCYAEQDARLVAAALWALVEKWAMP